ncbi:uncharacterized protein LOC133744462 [Rosa rugosa]|uniref:uncharacterized protein LOC133744462 n=1 Tax=Rosa rugosa TaxID=74645 RepID=UPI002B41666F|nr:uncharacterized protein LOC133744462 [Rosa rugosa]
MELFNQALLAKQGWRLLRYPDSLLAKTLKAKYFQDGDFLNARVSPGDLYTWRSLIKGNELLQKGARFQVGNGSSISMWYDPWLPRPHTFKPYNMVMEGLEELKSGYHVARKFLAPSSTAQSHDEIRKLWRAVWHARVQPKIRAFVWRLLKNILPTKDALRRRIGMEEQHCNIVACMWLYNPIGLRARSHAATSMKDWIMDVVGTLSKQQVDIFFMLLWTIWYERNRLAWNGGTFNPMHAVTWLMHLLENYQSLHPAKTSSKMNRGGVAKCLFPLHGRLKINIDGAFCADRGSGGVGVIIRDEKGSFKGAWSRFIPHMGQHSMVKRRPAEQDCC